MTRDVVFLVLDGLPDRWVRPEVTPTLARLAAEGGRAPGGALGVLTAATYPNHVTFVTGVDPLSHGVVANRRWNGVSFVPCGGAGVRHRRSLLPAAAGAGVRTVAAVGDQNLVEVLGLADAEVCWPPAGVLPDGAARDVSGYAADDAVLEAVLPELSLPLGTGDRRLTLLQLNGADTAGHHVGPDAPEATARYRAVDDAVRAVVEALAPRWRDTVLVVVSDHDQEPVTSDEPVDLAGELARRGLPWAVHAEGSAAVLHRLPDVDTTDPLPYLAGEAGRATWSADHLMIWGAPGEWFGDGAESDGRAPRGVHGSPRTRRQVAVVSGGHPQARLLAARVGGGHVTAVEWAPVLAGLLDVRWPVRTPRAPARSGLWTATSGEALWRAG